MRDPVRISVSTASLTGHIPPYLTGACIEDVNHEIYGGLYSQMIFGESFEEEPLEIDARLDPAFEGLSGTISCRAERTHLAACSDVRSWQPFRRGSALGHLQHTALRAFRGRYSQRITFAEGEGEVGIENQGLNRWGLHLVADHLYEGLVTVRAEVETPLLLALESRDGGHSYARATLKVPGDGAWHSLGCELTPDASDPAGRLSISLNAPGTVWVDYCFLQPGPWGRYQGLPVRGDIAGALVEQGLTVLRYGGYMINTGWEHEVRCPGSGYRWKKMLGPREQRPPYLGTFYSYNTNGFGIIEYVQFCEAAGLLCVPTVSPYESPDDLADLVQYLNGDTSTTWGARRAADGHPAPYRVRYLEIGNEEMEHDSNKRTLVRAEYPELFDRHAEAISAADPDLTMIMAPHVSRVRELGYPENRERMQHLLASARGRRVLCDVHIWGDQLRDGDVAEDFIRQFRAFLDEIDPGNAVGLCVLEENGFRHDLQRALGHAHNINTLERLAGAVQIDCAANCLQAWQQHDNYWDQGQVFYTPTQVWGMPPFYAQQMIARAYQPLGVEALVQSDGGALDISATRDEAGDTVVLKVVNLEAEDLPATVTVTGLCAGTVDIVCLAGDLEAANSPEAPRAIVPEETSRTWVGAALDHVFPGHSFTVMRFSRQ